MPAQLRVYSNDRSFLEGFRDGILFEGGNSSLGENMVILSPKDDMEYGDKSGAEYKLVLIVEDNDLDYNMVELR